MIAQDITQDYKAIDFLRTVDYFNVLADGTHDGPHTLQNCWSPDALATYDGTDAYRRRYSLHIPVAEWFDSAIQVQRQDYVMVSETQTLADQSATTVTRKYIVDEADFDQRLQLWRLQLFTLNK